MATTTKRAASMVGTSKRSRPATSGNKNVTGKKSQSSLPAQLSKVNGVMNSNLAGPGL